MNDFTLRNQTRASQGVTSENQIIHENLNHHPITDLATETLSRTTPPPSVTLSQIKADPLDDLFDFLEGSAFKVESGEMLEQTKVKQEDGVLTGRETSVEKETKGTEVEINGTKLSLEGVTKGVESLKERKIGAEEVHGGEAEEKAARKLVDSYLGNMKSTMQHGVTLEYTNGRYRAKSVANSPLEDINRALKENQIAFAVKGRIYVDPASGLKKGDRIEVDDEHGQTQVYTVDFLTKQQTDKLYKNMTEFVDMITKRHILENEKEKDKPKLDDPKTPLPNPAPEIKKEKVEKKEPKEKGKKLGPTQLELDKRADVVAIRQKAAYQKDETASNIREEAVRKDQTKEEIKSTLRKKG